MKKTVLAMMLAVAVTAVAQTTAPAQPAPQQSPAPPPSSAPPSGASQTATPPSAASQPTTPAGATPQQGAAPAAAPQKKEIKDPAEYNAYVGAVQQTDPAAKVSGLEAFLTQYPNSVMKEDALGYLMAAYQQTGNQAHDELAERLGMIEVFNGTQRKPPRSFPAVLPVFRLDRIYVRGFNVVDASVLSGRNWSRVTDHAALSATLAASGN